MFARRRSLLFGFLTLAVVFLVCELMATVALERIETRLRFPEPALYVAEPVTVERLARRFDAELGWVHRYDTPDGERPRAVHYDRPVVATFGDSFTRGDEVEDHETWAEALAGMIEGDVYNFGVGGYGMDQALLRFERDGPRRPVPITIFGYISGDLVRCFRRYWKFHHPESPFPMTKPRLLLEDDQLELMPNAVDTVEELHAGVQDLDFVERLAQEDPWFNPHGLPPRRRPHLLLLARPSLWRAASMAGEPHDVWQRPDAVRLAELILLRFVRVARERGTLPVILQLPSHFQMEAHLERGEEPAVVRETRAICERHDLDCIIPLLAEEPGKMGARWQYFVRGKKGGHYSALGNRWMAGHVARRLEEIAPQILGR